MIGQARAMGAISIVNAIASGKGASVAVNLPSNARVTVDEKRGKWRVVANGKPTASSLAQQTAKMAIKLLGKDPARYSGSIETTTSTPPGVGLKTSSSASVAIALAVLSAFGVKTYRAPDVLRCSALASLAAGVSITGAIDDAASCLLGGVNFADNVANRLLSSAHVGSQKVVLIRIPKAKSRRSTVPTQYVRRFSKEAESIFETGRQGKIWEAMILNGLLYSSIYGYEPSYALEALTEGAISAGLSGTGPAVAAVFEDWGDSESLAKRWSGKGTTLIRTETTDGGATLGP